MPKTDLEVPYHQKALARALGARWDAERRLWYVAETADLARFSQWLPAPPRPNHRAASYAILESLRSCWRCEATTRVFGFALPHGHESLEQLGDPEDFSDEAAYRAWLDGADAMQWIRQNHAAVLCYIRHLSPTALARMQALTPQYRKNFSATTGTFYYMNHCEQCDAKLGDFETIEECDAPLRPLVPDLRSPLRPCEGTEAVEAESSSAELAPGVI